MNYFRWQSETGRAWLERKSAEWVTFRRLSTMGVWYRERRKGGREETEKTVDNKNRIGKNREKMKKGKKRKGAGDQAASEGEKETEGKGEPGCRGALPAVCVVHAFQPGGSKPGKGKAHTHAHMHTHRHAQQFPKAKHLLNTKTHYIHTCTILHKV